jgi:hypothetical protein
MKAGITGHQALGSPGDVAWVRRTLARLVREEGATAGVSSLAEGADQVFAEVLRDAGLPLVAVLPCAGYEAAFRSPGARAAYAALLAEAAERVQLPFDAPSELAFLAAGKEVVERCDLLLAVWDGAPARGLGGTADVVAFAVARGRRTLHVQPAARTVRVLQAAARTE